MSIELDADERAARPLSALGSVLRDEPMDRRRPNLSGDLPTVFESAPMFRRALTGYDRFQVETYVQWAEDELATADSEREHLLTRLVQTRAELDEASRLLSHSAGARPFLQVSGQIATMLAVAADEAESIKVEADAESSVAAAQAARTVARADRVLADAEAEAARTTAAAAADAEQVTAAAGRMLDEVEQMRRDARMEAEALLAEARAIEQRATAHGEQILRQAREEAALDRLRARDEIIRMLSTGREERRRADAEAAATRQRMDRDAAARHALLVAEVEALEHRRSALRAEAELLTVPVAGPSGGRLDVHLPRLLERLGRGARSRGLTG